MIFSMLTKDDKKYIEDRIEKKIDALAIIIQKGFAEVFAKLDTKADKEDVKKLENRMDNLGNRMDSLEDRMYKIEGRMNTLEFRLVTGPNNRIDRVEDDIRIIKSKLGLS